MVKQEATTSEYKRQLDQAHQTISNLQVGLPLWYDPVPTMSADFRVVQLMQADNTVHRK